MRIRINLAVRALTILLLATVLGAGLGRSQSITFGGAPIKGKAGVG